MRGREESGVHFPSQRSSFKNYFSYQYDKLRIESRGYEKHLTDEEKGRLKTELFLTKQGLAELLKKPLPDYGSMYLQVEQVKIVVEKYASMAKSNQLLIDILEDAVIFEAMLGDPIIPNVPKEDIIRVIQEMIDDRRPELESLGESLAKTLFERHKIKLHPEDVINIIPFLLSKTKILDSMP